MFKPILPQIPAAVLENLSPEARENMTAICNLIDFTLGGMSAICADLLNPENQCEAANTGEEFRSMIVGLGETLLMPAEAAALALYDRPEFLSRTGKLGSVGRETLAELSATSTLADLPGISGIPNLPSSLN